MFADYYWKIYTPFTPQKHWISVLRGLFTFPSKALNDPLLKEKYMGHKSGSPEKLLQENNQQQAPAQAKGTEAAK